MENFPEIWHKAMAVVGFVACHVFLWGVSLIKFKFTKDPSRVKHDKRLDKIIKKYDTFLRNIEKRRREEIRELNYMPIENSDMTPKKNYQIDFMREVLYNYLDKELKVDRVD